MKTTSKLIGSVLALIIVILAIFLVTKFNSHESARVSTSSSQTKIVKKSSSSSSKSTKNDKKNSNPHVKNEDTKDETVEVSESSVAMKRSYLQEVFLRLQKKKQEKKHKHHH